MRPAFRLAANGQDVTATLADRLLELSVAETDGESADRLRIVLDDRDSRVALPEMRARLELSLGFAGRGLTPMGVFEVESVAGEAPPRRLTIAATAVNLQTGSRAPRTRAFEGRTLRQIVEQIAADAGLEPVVGASIAGERWDYLAQTAESDLHFLTRIARQLDATAKAVSGRLVVVRRGEGVTAEGAPIEPVTVPASALARWSWHLKTREVDASVAADWQDTATGERRRARAGSGSPERLLRAVFASEAEAARAAQAARSAARRRALDISAEGAFAPGLFAGGLLRLRGIRPEFEDGDWTVRSVTHRLAGSGLSTAFTAQREFQT